jgi:hypothetical protein
MQGKAAQATTRTKLAEVISIDPQAGDFEDLVEYIDAIMHLCDQRVFENAAGSKITITVSEEGWCIEAEDDEAQFDADPKTKPTPAEEPDDDGDGEDNEEDDDEEE